MFGIFDDFLKFCNITFGQKIMITLDHLAFNLNPFFYGIPTQGLQIPKTQILGIQSDTSCNMQCSGKREKNCNKKWVVVYDYLNDLIKTFNSLFETDN